jgi:hypothetical protein
VRRRVKVWLLGMAVIVPVVLTLAWSDPWDHWTGSWATIIAGCILGWTLLVLLVRDL